MKKLLVFTLLCIAFFQGYTQNTDYYDRMEHIFGNIDKNKVTTGFLKEFSYSFNVSQYQNGHYFIRISCGDISEMYQIVIDN